MRRSLGGEGPDDEAPLRIRPGGASGGGSDGRRSRDLTIFSRALYQLSYRALMEREPLPKERLPSSATLTGLEPATSAVTGRHANQLRYRAMLVELEVCCDPNGIRTRAAAVKGRCPRPLNDGAMTKTKATEGQAYGRPALIANCPGCRETGDSTGRFAVAGLGSTRP